MKVHMDSPTKWQSTKSIKLKSKKIQKNAKNVNRCENWVPVLSQKSKIPKEYKHKSKNSKKSKKHKNAN